MEYEKETDILASLKKDLFLTSHYDLLELLGVGCFGKILKAKNKRTGQHIALKVESNKKAKLKLVLKNQIEIMKKLQGVQGIPQIYAHGQWENGTYLEMDLLNHDLNRSYEYSSSQITELTLEAIKILEGIHMNNVVHQDLKPHNLMRGQNGTLYLIDFGLAKQIPIRNKSRPALRGFIGTPRYASIRAHNLLQQGKKDDLQSLFYNLAFLYYRRLPWSKLNVPNEQRLEKIKLLKIKHQETLFAEMPPQFQRAFDYITSLQSHNDPDYAHIKSYFRRNKTLVIDPSIVLNLEERRNVKRVSLNSSNFLQVPEPIFKKEKSRKRGKDESFESSKIMRSSSATSLSAFSDAIQSQFLKMVEEDEQNFREDENIEPQLPNSVKLSSLVFKNPFSC